MRNPSISRELLAALQQFQLTTFSVADLTYAYLDKPGKVHTSQKAARQFVYRNMLRLLHNGALERVPNGRRWPVYKLTKPFVAKMDAFAVSAQSPLTKSATLESRSLEKLRERLNIHKVEMLTAMGEAEEYNAICSEMPEIRLEVQARYNQARDRCSRLLGKVKALESLLGQVSA